MTAVRMACAGMLVVFVTLATPAGAGTRDAHAHRRLVAAITTDLVAHPAIPGEAVSVRAPGLAVAAARGYADVATRTPLRVDTPFRIASVTKTFVAAAVLRLVERGTLMLDAPISKYLSPEAAAALTRGGYRPGRITVHQLLDHTSGLFDYAGSDAYDDVNVDDPGHHWTRAEQLAFAMDHGHRLAAPGREYHYADTNYILLGEILERASGEPIAGAVRTAIGFGRLGLDHTWWEQFEAPPVGLAARAHQYFDATFDNVALDASSDLYGGGGLVSTVGDVTRFFRALFDGRVFDHADTLDAMLTVSQPGRRAGAALGIFAADIAGERCWGHPGYWGTEAYFCPKSSLAFAIATNQADEDTIDTTALQRTISRLG